MSHRFTFDDFTELSESEDEAVAEMRNPEHKDHQEWWRKESIAFAEVCYNSCVRHEGRLDQKSVNADGKVSCSRLHDMCCEEIRKQMFIAAWVRATKWVAEKDGKFDQALYELAHKVLEMDTKSIRRQFHLPP
jgi:hypothetical protein